MIKDIISLAQILKDMDKSFSEKLKDMEVSFSENLKTIQDKNICKVLDLQREIDQTKRIIDTCLDVEKIIIEKIEINKPDNKPGQQYDVLFVRNDSEDFLTLQRNGYKVDEEYLALYPTATIIRMVSTVK